MVSPLVQQVVEGFAGSIEEEIESRLEHVWVFGSAARGDWDPERSDVNVLVVVDEVDRDVLDAVRRCTLEARAELLIHPRVVTEAEIQGSADVLPMQTADLARHHHVVYGEGLEIPTIAKSHLRLRVEQQFRALAGQIRSSYLKYRDKPDRLAAELGKTANVFFLTLECWIYLENGDWPKDREEVFRVGANFAGAEPSLFERLATMGDDPDRILPHFEELEEAVDSLVEQVDGKEIW